jgi:CHASE1-domain containing sensor protein
MGITSFVLGMLTIVAVLIVTAIVAGIVKINKLTKEQNSLYQLFTDSESNLRKEIDHIYRAMQSDNQDLWRQFEKTGVDVTMVEKTLMNQIEETKRYVDSRIDKVAAKGTKTVING